MSYMKKPCKSCPYRCDVKPFLTPERGEELAYLPTNPYNEFYCHNTLEHGEDGDTIMNLKSKTCAGFLTIRANELGENTLPNGFVPSYEECYTDSYDMADAYEDHRL